MSERENAGEAPVMVCERCERPGEKRAPGLVESTCSRCDDPTYRYLIRSPDTKEREAGRFPPQAGDVWRWFNGQTHTFTGRTVMHATLCNVAIRDADGQEANCTGDEKEFRKHFTFVRQAGATPTPAPAVEVCSACGGNSFAGPECLPCAAKRGPVPAPVLDTPPKPKPRATYASLMAEARKADGVKGQVTCLRCGKPSRLNTLCAACHAFDDARTALRMDIEGRGIKARIVEEPWRPSCDIDHDIPNVGEYGDRGPT